MKETKFSFYGYPEIIDNLHSFLENKKNCTDSFDRQECTLHTEKSKGGRCIELTVSSPDEVSEMSLMFTVVGLKLESGFPNPAFIMK